jgi:sugar lactone lactonase YvrE
MTANTARPASRAGFGEFGRAVVALAVAAVVTCAAVGLAGCAKPAGPVFPPLADGPAWPAAPEQPRVRYVGQLTQDADLKPARAFHQRLGTAMFGRKPARSMLTPYAVCTDGEQRLFVADSNAQVVHVFDLKTRRYARWAPAAPKAADGKGTERRQQKQPRRFTQPVGLAYDRGAGGRDDARLYVADGVGGAVAVFDGRTGRPLGEVGRGALGRPCGLAFDAARGRLLVADAALHLLVALDRAGRVVTTVGGRGAGDGQFNFPTNVAVDSRGRVYVADSLNFRVQQFTPDLAFARRIGAGKGDLPGYFGQPKGVAVDAADHLYVVDAHFEAVQVFDAGGRLLMTFGEEGRGPGQFWLPAGIHIDPADRVWVADAYNRRVQVFAFLRQPDGNGAPPAPAPRSATEGTP